MLKVFTWKEKEHCGDAAVVVVIVVVLDALMKVENKEQIVVGFYVFIENRLRQ